MANDKDRDKGERTAHDIERFSDEGNVAPAVEKARRALGDDRGASGGDEPGEGNRAADRRYRDATRRFIDGGKVAPAADEARRALDDPKERKDLEQAERIGRSRAAEHDPK